MTPGYNTWNHRDFSSGGGDDTRYNDFPGGGTDNHQSTLWWTDPVAQEATTSTSLAPAKPNNIENNDRLEVSIFLPHRQSCSIIVGLPTVKQSDCLRLGAWLRPPSECQGEDPAFCPDPRDPWDSSDGGRAPDSSAKYVSSSGNGDRESVFGT